MSNSPNSEIKILDKLAPWVLEIKYNPEQSNWNARFLPNRTVIEPSLSKVVAALEKHVLKEILELASEALEQDATNVVTGSRIRELSDLRFIVAIIAGQQFGCIRQKAIANLLGYANCSVVSFARKQIKVAEVQQKVNRVYKTFPQLQSGSIEILNRN